MLCPKLCCLRVFLIQDTSSAWDTAYIVLCVTTDLMLLVRCSLSCLSCGKHQQKGQALRGMSSTGLAAVRLLAWLHESAHNACPNT